MSGPTAPGSLPVAAGPADAGPGTQLGTVRHRPLREASLELRRIDPWAMLKVSLIVSIVMFFVWMLIVAVLYLSFGSLDVWNKINATYETLATTNPGPLITANGVFIVAAVLGAINIVLFTTLSTIVSFLYNAAAGMTGGVEITLAERS
jgi:hypothetical protein